MPTMGYAAAELYFVRRKKQLSTFSPDKLEYIINKFEEKKFYQRLLHTVFCSTTYLDYSAAKSIIK